MQARVANKKKDEVAKLTSLIQEYPIVGVVDITSLPSAQLQAIRKRLKKDMLLRITKKRLFRLAIKQIKNKQGLEQLENSLNHCMPALVLTKESPFKLSKLLIQNKSKALAKVGQKAPRDLVIPAGPTPFGPGPIIGELGAAGIKAAIEGGKVVIREDKLLVKEGEIITKKQSDLLAKFNIKPMEIGINVVSLYEKGIVYLSSVLSIDEAEYVNKLRDAHHSALALALSKHILTKDTIKQELSQAHRAAYGLAVSKDIVTDETLKNILSKGEAQANIIQNLVIDSQK